MQYSNTHCYKLTRSQDLSSPLEPQLGVLNSSHFLFHDLWAIKITMEYQFSSTTIFHRAFISASLITKAYIINSINTPFGPLLCNFFENRTFLIEGIIQKQSKMALRVISHNSNLLCGPKLAVFAGRMICSQLCHF